MLDNCAYLCLLVHGCVSPYIGPVLDPAVVSAVHGGHRCRARFATQTWKPGRPVRGLRARHKPYFRLIEPGLHLGYRKLTSGPGTWLARRYSGEGRYVV